MFVLIVVVMLVQQYASHVAPDMTVMVVTQKVSLSKNDITKIDNMLEKYTSDVNNDGRKNVSCDDFELGTIIDVQATGVLQAKMYSDLKSVNNVLFITDDTYFSSLNKQGEFEKISEAIPGAPDKLSIQLSSLPDFKDSGLSADTGKLYLSVRKYAGSQLTQKSNQPYYNNSISVLKTMLKNGNLL